MTQCVNPECRGLHPGQTRESAFQDTVIKVEIKGDTVDQINRVAEHAGLTSAQWIRINVVAALEHDLAQLDRLVELEAELITSGVIS